MGDDGGGGPQGWLLALLCRFAEVKFACLTTDSHSLSDPTTTAAAAARGWAVEGGFVEPKAPEPAGNGAEAAAQRSLQRLAEYVVHLEA